SQYSRSCLASFFFPQSPPPQIYTLSLHDALPIFGHLRGEEAHLVGAVGRQTQRAPGTPAQLDQLLGDRLGRQRHRPEEREALPPPLARLQQREQVGGIRHQLRGAFTLDPCQLIVSVRLE